MESDGKLNEDFLQQSHRDSEQKEHACLIDELAGIAAKAILHFSYGPRPKGRGYTEELNP